MEYRFGYLISKAGILNRQPHTASLSAVLPFDICDKLVIPRAALQHDGVLFLIDGGI